MAILGKWSGGTVAGVPSTSWAAPVSLFPTQDRNDSSAYSFSASTSVLTLPSSGLADGYMLVGAFEITDTSNGRGNPQGQFIQASGTGNFVSGASGGFCRDTSEDTAYVRTWAFIDGPSASATFTFQWKSDTDLAAGGTSRSELQVIPFYYSDIGLYTSTSASLYGGTTPNQVTGFTGTDGTNITLSSNVVSVTGDNKKYLVLASQFFEGRGGRSQRWHGLDIDGVQENAAKGYSYYRNTANDESGEMFTWMLETATATVTIEQTCYRGDGVANGEGGADSDGSTPASGAHALVVIELNDSAEGFRSQNSSDSSDLSSSPTDLDLNGTTSFSDSASFTDLADSSINCVVTADYLFGANISAASNNVGSTARWTAYAEFHINGAEDPDSFAGDYLRNNQGTIDTFGWSANLIGFQGLTAGDDVGVSVTELAGTENGGNAISPAGWSGFWGLNLDTLSAPSEGVTDVETTDFRFDNTNIVINGANFLVPEGTLYLNDAASKDGGEVDISSAIDSWADDEIVVDFSLLSAGALTNLHTQGPGTLYFIVENDDSDVYASAALTVHRPIALELALSAFVDPTSSPISPARLTGGTGTFLAGLVTEDTNPLASLDIASDGNTEVAFVFQGATGSVDAFVYEIEIVEDGTPDVEFDTYPTTSAQVTIGTTAISAEVTSGTFNLTGSAVASLKTHLTQPDSGTFNLTGAAVDGLRVLKAALSAGTFVLSGSAVDSLKIYLVELISGSFNLTGAAVDSLHHARTEVTSGTFNLTGTNVDSLHAKRTEVASGTFNLTGASVDSLHHQRTELDSGTFALSGSAVDTLQDTGTEVESALFNLIGTAVDSLYHQEVGLDSGAFNLTGTNVGSLYHQEVGLDSAVFNLTGSDVGTLLHTKVELDSGTYSISGSAVDTLLGKRTEVDAGSFAISPSDVDTLRHRLLEVEAGAYALTGLNILTGRHLVTSATAGTYSIAGSNVDTLYFRVSGATAGSFNLTGASLDTLQHSITEAVSGTYTVSGEDVSTAVSFVGTVPTGVFALTGGAVNTLYMRQEAVDSGAYTLTGGDIETSQDAATQVLSGSYALVGAAVNTLVDYADQVLSGSFALTGSSLDTFRTLTTSAESGSFALTGTAIEGLLHQVVELDSGSFVISGSDLDTFRGLSAQAESGSYALTGTDLATVPVRGSQVSAGSFTLSGQALSTLRHQVTLAQSGSFGLTGASVDSLKAYKTVAESGTFALSGQSLGSFKNYLSEVASGTYNLNGAEILSTYTAVNNLLNRYTLSIKRSLYGSSDSLAVATQVNFNDGAALHIKSTEDVTLYTKSSDGAALYIKSSLLLE